MVQERFYFVSDLFSPVSRVRNRINVTYFEKKIFKTCLLKDHEFKKRQIDGLINVYCSISEYKLFFF